MHQLLASTTDVTSAAQCEPKNVLDRNTPVIIEYSIINGRNVVSPMSNRNTCQLLIYGGKQGLPAIDPSVTMWDLPVIP